MHYVYMEPGSQDPSSQETGNYYCSECSKSYTTQAGLKYHMMAHTGDFPFWCEKCDKGFGSKAVYQAHIDKHDANPKSTEYRCAECDKVYSTPCGLRNHMQKHTGQFRYWCGECQKGFPYKSDYQRHMDKHEGISYPCQKCEKRFDTPYRLKGHYQKAHAGKTLPQPLQTL